MYQQQLQTACLLSATIMLFSCTSKTNNQPAAAHLSLEKLDTILTRPAHIRSKPLLFEAAFIKGTKHTANGYTADLFGFTIGDFISQSGKIVACDPELMEEYGIAFTQTFPTGTFPVQLAVAKLGAEEKIAYARILFNNEPVASW